MRVYALAKQLGMENRDLIPELKRMGITVASHSSALDDDVVQKALEKLGPKAEATGRDRGRCWSGVTGVMRMDGGHHAAGAKGAGRLSCPQLRSLPSPTNAAF